MKMAFGAGLGVAVSLVATPVRAEMTVSGATYQCERGVEIVATYVNDAEAAVAVINVEGRQIALKITRSASGARYAWPSDGSGYVWWTRGDDATLLWSDGTGGEEVTLLAACHARM